MKQLVRKGPNSQQGIVLLMALLMLLLVTLMVVGGFSLTQTNLQVMHNLESRALARHAANSALEEALSSDLFLKGATVFDSNCGVANRKCYNLNDDSVAADVNVDVVANCLIVRPITNQEILKLAGIGLSTGDGTSPENAFGGTGNLAWASCLSGTNTGNSQCSAVVWNMVATASDIQTGAQSVVRQGVFTSADSDNTNSICK